MNRFNIRVYGVLIDELNRILLSDEFIKGGFFTKFPGGGLEFGEGTKDCLIREFKEETNLDVTLGEFYEAIQQDFVKKRTVQLIINVIPENYNVKIHILYINKKDCIELKTVDNISYRHIVGKNLESRKKMSFGIFSHLPYVIGYNFV